MLHSGKTRQKGSPVSTLQKKRKQKLFTVPFILSPLNDVFFKQQNFNFELLKVSLSSEPRFVGILMSIISSAVLICSVAFSMPTLLSM